MVAIIGMFFQDGLTGSAWGDWSLYTDSPLRAFEGELGVQPPFGYWDPLGYSADGDAKAFRRRRETELKHGRVSMIACIGYITPEYFKFPGDLSPTSGLSFSDVPNGLKAFSQVPALGWVQMFLFCGLVELGLFRADASREPGDFEKAGILGVPNASGPIADAEARTRKLSAELANGRLAMVAIIGMFFQDGLTGSAWGDWALYTDSPLRAFEGELGVQPPFGFWDPLGMSSDGDLESFKRRRATELKHGRVSMLACLGYITPEYFKFPGYCSPSSNLTFQDVPNGLAALSKVPGAGWLQMIAFVGAMEKGFLKQDDTRAPGDFANAGALGVPNGKIISKGEDRTRKLNAELANGRLAMMAIIGMFYQDGLTGSAWGDWANYTSSPLRAFENELGVQAPVGYWDPLGLSKDGNVDAFRRRRETELKHGRICMLATIGYFVTGMGYRFPGSLSPSTGLSFEGSPGGLEAIGVVPALGWAQIFIFCGLVDFGLYRQDPARGPGDFENGGILGVPNASGPMSDAEGRKRKLNAELANGRLGMFAIMGMLFQNGWVGSSGPEMWGF